MSSWFRISQAHEAKVIGARVSRPRVFRINGCTGVSGAQSDELAGETPALRAALAARRCALLLRRYLLKCLPDFLTDYDHTGLIEAFAKLFDLAGALCGLSARFFLARRLLTSRSDALMVAVGLEPTDILGNDLASRSDV